jgi:uncharacterized membrane protein
LDRLTRIFVILSAAGIPIAIYHAYDEITSYSAPDTACRINDFLTCVGVFQSGYTKFLGISLWVFGVVWFPLILGSGVWSARRRGWVDGGLMLPILMVGNIFTIYLWYLELGVIRAVCPVCVFLYALNYAMTAVSAIVALRR